MRLEDLLHIACLVLLQLGPSLSISVLEVVVPPVVAAGDPVTLECHYSEDGDKLYSLRWWRGNEQFYQLVPPKRSFYRGVGVKVDMLATESMNVNSSKGVEKVRLEGLDLDAAGVYKCEVMADINFHTVFKEKNLTVVYTPDGTPTLTGMEELSAVRPGQRVLLNCSVPPASPLPRITWLINGKNAPHEWYISHSPRYARGPVSVSSTLDFEISHNILREGRGSVQIQCLAQQQHSGYHRHTSITLQREDQGIFGLLFTSNSSTLFVDFSTRVLVISLLVFFFYRP